MAGRKRASLYFQLTIAFISHTMCIEYMVYHIGVYIMVLCYYCNSLIAIGNKFYSENLRFQSFRPCVYNLEYQRSLIVPIHSFLVGKLFYLQIWYIGIGTIKCLLAESTFIGFLIFNYSQLQGRSSILFTSDMVVQKLRKLKYH